jgi:hypothetical protein
MNEIKKVMRMMTEAMGRTNLDSIEGEEDREVLV